MKKQARDIAKTSNGKVVLVAADELKVTSSFYGSIFAEKEKINGKTEYSKIPISLLEVGGSKKNVTFYLDVDQAEYLYEFAKSFGDCSYSDRVSITISLKNIHGIWKLRLLKMKRKKKAVSI